jgi:hypothetical protein
VTAFPASGCRNRQRNLMWPRTGAVQGPFDPWSRRPVPEAPPPNRSSIRLM